MAEGRSQTYIALVLRELQEYRTSLCWTPLVLVMTLCGVLLVAVLLADHISAIGESVSQVLPSRDEGGNISIRIDNSVDGEPALEYRLEQTPAAPGNLNPGSVGEEQPDALALAGTLNPLLQGIHNLFLFILILVCANYLLATLFNDRRDRSVLFWKSMPVSEWEEVLAKFSVAILVTPALYFIASLLAQVMCLLLGMLLLWRMEMDPYALVLARVDGATLILGQLGGFVLMALWLAPSYAWLLLASAGARRSPFMLAAGPLLAFILGERIFLGTSHLATVLSRHLPHYSGGGYAGFSWLGAADIPQMLLGLLFALAALAGAVYLRRYYFEL